MAAAGRQRPERPGKGSGATETGQGRPEGRRARRAERGEKSCYWRPRPAYLAVVLHVVAQADEAGLKLLGPQRAAVVLVRGRPGVGEGPGSHAEGGRGEGDTWGEGNTELEGTWLGGGQGWARTGVGAVWCEGAGKGMLFHL